MFSIEAREIIKDVLELFAQASELPIAMYEVGADGRMSEVARSDDDLFPAHCFAVWKLNGGEGRKVCDENMCSRAKTGFELPAQPPMLCHAGLTVSMDPIRVQGKIIAVILYGAYTVSDESDPGLRIARHERAMRALKATRGQATEIKNLLLNETAQAEKAEWDWLHKTLPPIISRLIEKYILHAEREKRILRLAYHDVQLRLQSALSLAENVSRHIKKEAHPNMKRVEEIDYVTGAIEAAGTVMHNSSRGQYLPENYRFIYHPVSSFINSALMMCRQEAREREIEFEKELQPEGGHFRIQASDLHLQQAFNNLFQNAVKYSYRRPALKPGETVRPYRFISIRGMPHREHGELGYRISIGNYGVGIEPDELEKIFTEGYQGQLTKAEYRTGSGQGLDLTKRIITKHHGTISAQSEPRGESVEDGTRPYHTVFTVWLPARQSTE